jgi:methyl-accepting chemotaxis protein
MAQQFTAASHALARESEMLAALVSDFRTEAEPAFQQRPNGGSRRPPAPEPAPRSPRPQRVPSRMPRTAAPTSAAIAWDDPDEAWQEF